MENQYAVSQPTLPGLTTKNKSALPHAVVRQHSSILPSTPLELLRHQDHNKKPHTYFGILPISAPQTQREKDSLSRDQSHWPSSVWCGKGAVPNDECLRTNFPKFVTLGICAAGSPHYPLGASGDNKKFYGSYATRSNGEVIR